MKKFNEVLIKQVRELKASGTPNLDLMEMFKLTYAELREVLDGK